MSVSSANHDNDRMSRAAQALRLLDAPGLGPHRLYRMMETHGGLDQVEQFLLRSDRAPARVRDHLAHTSVGRYQAIMDETIASGAGYKLWDDVDYPANLGLWGARPAVLFYRGDLTHLGQRSLALVGRVDPSPKGAEAAEKFARLCVEHDITVVSGLAKGIDGASHRAALADPPGYTYAVVGHGLDHAYPRENSDLYEQIPHHGAIVSQFPLGVGPQRWTFPARNEVMCTLALGTVIIEGKPGCGSIIQADFSFKHGRPVFLLSRNLREGETHWAEDLVAKGAHVIEYFEQALEGVKTAMGKLWSETSTTAPLAQDGLFAAAQVEPEPLHTSDTAGVRRRTASPRPPQKESMTTTPALLFDIDGVIADSRRTTATALAAIAQRHTDTRHDPATLIVTGSPHKVLAGLGVPSAWKVYKDEFDTEFRQAATSHMRVFTEVVQGIRELKAAGVKLGTITAQPRRRADQLLDPDLRSLFDINLTYGETKGNKVTGIRRALQDLNVPADLAAYIGDTPKDLQDAASAGVFGVGVGWGFTDLATLSRTPHTLMLRDPSQINRSLIDVLFH